MKRCDWFFKLLNTVLECSDLLHIVKNSFIKMQGKNIWKKNVKESIRLFRGISLEVFFQVQVFYISKHNYIRYMNSCKF